MREGAKPLGQVPQVPRCVSGLNVKLAPSSSTSTSQPSTVTTNLHVVENKPHIRSSHCVGPQDVRRVKNEGMHALV